MTYFAIDPIEQREAALDRLDYATDQLEKAEKAYRKRPTALNLDLLREAITDATDARALVQEWRP